MARPQNYTSHTSWLQPPPLGTHLTSARARGCKASEKSYAETGAQSGYGALIHTGHFVAFAIFADGVRKVELRRRRASGIPSAKLILYDAPVVVFVCCGFFFATEEICGLMFAVAGGIGRGSSGRSGRRGESQREREREVRFPKLLQEQGVDDVCGRGREREERG